MNTKKRVLDVGCGESSETPKFLRELLNKESVFVVGVDWSFIFCKQSKNVAQRYNLDAEYVRCDAACLPFRDAIFHIICMLGSLRCLKGHSLEKFVNETLQKLVPEGELYIIGLDRVSFQQVNLPAFKDYSLSFSWGVYVPRNKSSPFIIQEPACTEGYKYVGVLPEHIVSELLGRCSIESETTWKTEKEGNYSHHRYVIRAKKSRP